MNHCGGDGCLSDDLCGSSSYFNHEPANCPLSPAVAVWNFNPLTIRQPKKAPKFGRMTSANAHERIDRIFSIEKLCWSRMFQPIQKSNCCTPTQNFKLYYYTPWIQLLNTFQYTRIDKKWAVKLMFLFNRIVFRTTRYALINPLNYYYSIMVPTRVKNDDLQTKIDALGSKVDALEPTFSGNDCNLKNF